MKWSRVAAFIAQTINAVLKTHDIFEVEKAIKELEKYVKTRSSRLDKLLDEIITSK